MKKDLSNNYTIKSPLKEDVSIIVPGAYSNRFFGRFAPPETKNHPYIFFSQTGLWPPLRMVDLTL